LAFCERIVANQLFPENLTAAESFGCIPLHPLLHCGYNVEMPWRFPGKSPINLGNTVGAKAIGPFIPGCRIISTSFSEGK
jgi:hypothetical protein